MSDVQHTPTLTKFLVLHDDVVAVMKFICIRGDWFERWKFRGFPQPLQAMVERYLCLRPPPTKSLSNHCSWSISLLVVHHISAEAEISSLHELEIRRHSQRAYRFTVYALNLKCTLNRYWTVSTLSNNRCRKLRISLGVSVAGQARYCTLPVCKVTILYGDQFQRCREDFKIYLKTASK
jgi:hypothetical protein